MFIKNSNKNFNVDVNGFDDRQSYQNNQNRNKMKNPHQAKQKQQSLSCSEQASQKKETKMMMEINIKRPLYKNNDKDKENHSSAPVPQRCELLESHNLNRSFHVDIDDEAEQIKQNLSSMYSEIQTKQTEFLQNWSKNQKSNKNVKKNDGNFTQRDRRFLQVQNTNSQAQKENQNVQFFQLPSGKLKTNKSIGHVQGHAQSSTSQKKQKNKAATSIESQNKSTKQSFRQFTYTAQSFILIQKLFAEYSLLNKMEITQNTNQFITVRKNQKNSILNFANCCIMKVCFKGNNQNQVYQLKNMTVKKGSGLKASQQSFNFFKAKIIMISGEVSKFDVFCQKFLYTLFLKDFLLLNHPQEAINLILLQKKSQIQILKRKFTQFYNTLSYNKITDSYQKTLITLCIQAKNLEEQIKYEFQRKSSKKIQIQDSVYDLDLASQSQLLKQYYKEIGLIKVFQLYTKSQKAQLAQKIDTIIRKNNIENIFLHLQIGEHYQLFLNNQKNSLNSNKIQQVPLKLRYPYLQCIQILQKINSSKQESPHQWLKLFSDYFQTLKNVHQTLYKNKMKLTDIELDVDDQISITVFCLLFCHISNHNENSTSQTKRNDNNYLISIIRFLQIYLQHCQDSSSINIKLNEHNSKSKSKSNRLQGQAQMLKKIIANFNAALQYIQKQWKMDG